MSHPHRPGLRASLAAIVSALALILLLPMAAAAHGGKGHEHGHKHHGHGKGKRDLSVLTQNLYLGSSLVPALEATTPTEFFEAVAQIYATVQLTDFPARAEAIADEIQAKEPDLIGLQEVEKWTTIGLTESSEPPPGYDFLEILEGDLAARGLDYSVAAVSSNANIGPAPLLAEGCTALPEPPFSTCLVTLEDRDVILVNEDTPGLTWGNPQSGHYEAQRVIELPVGSESFDRGWASIDARLKGLPFRFVNTHLETEEDATVQEAEAAEFLAGPAKGGTVVATGDFNSAADGSTTGSYAQLTAPGKFRDAWDEAQLGPGLTCCQEPTLSNSEPTLQTRIDLILSRGAARSDGDEAEVVGGDTPFQMEPPFWPSDHAGVVATLHLSH